MVKVNEHQTFIDARFKAIEIYLNLSYKKTKESALQDWFSKRK